MRIHHERDHPHYCLMHNRHPNSPLRHSNDPEVDCRRCRGERTDRPAPAGGVRR